MSGDRTAAAPVVVESKRRRGPAGVWTTRFQAHRAGCRAAGDAHPVGGLLDLWGGYWFARLVADGTVSRCPSCRPDLDPVVKAAAASR